MAARAPSLALLGLLLAASGASAAPAQVVIIRHGEKPPEGDELDERGWQRARALVEFFKSSPRVTRHGAPAAIYAMDPKAGGGSLRPIQTVTPLAQSLGLGIDHRYKKDQLPELVKLIMEDRRLDGRMVLVCWEHKVIPTLLRDFGWSSGPDKWKGSVFDRAWVLNFQDGKPTSFEDVPEHVLPGDSEE